MSGVNLPLKNLWKTSDWFHGTFIISISLWGTLAGSLLGGYPTEAWGRKRTLIIVGFTFVLSALGTSLATTAYVFSFCRFIEGTAAGAGLIAAPTYMAEIAHAGHRGKSAMLFQLNIVLGILAAMLSNYFFVNMDGEKSWRRMISIMLIPSALYSLLLFRICESPRWLNQKKQDAAKAIQELNKANPTDVVHTRKQSAKQPKIESQAEMLFSRRNSNVLILSFLMAFFNQFSGISFVIFYAPEILEKAGWITAQSLLGTVCIGIVNIIFTITGIFLIDKIGRKPLMYIGSIGYIISLLMISFSFFYSYPAMFTLLFMLLFMASHAIGQGAVIWVFMAEIFPTKIRAFGQAWGASLVNGFAALIALLGPVLISELRPGKAFFIFALLMIFQLLFVRFLMPETKGTSLEMLEDRVVNRSH